MIGAVVVAVLPLFFILGRPRDPRARAASRSAFFTKMPAPAGETGGGVAHAIVGTLLIVGTACLIGLPVGIAAGIYCAEYPGQPAHLGHPVRGRRDERHAVDRGRRLRLGLDRGARRSTSRRWPGSAALAMLMIPMVLRTTEEMIKLVPQLAARGGAGAGLSALAHQPQRSWCAPRCPGIVTGEPAGGGPHRRARPRRSSSPRSAAST